MFKLKQLVFNSAENNNSSSSPQSENERNLKYPEFRIAPNFEGSAILFTLSVGNVEPGRLMFHKPMRNLFLAVAHEQTPHIAGKLNSEVYHY